MILLTEPEAAKRLRIGERTLRNLRANGLIRYVALSTRKIAYRPEDCDEYVESQIKRAEPPRGKPQPKAKISQRKPGNVVPFTQQVGR